MRREYFRIPPEITKDSSIQNALVTGPPRHVLNFHFPLRQSNHVQYYNEYLQVSNLVRELVPRRYTVACDFLLFADIYGTFSKLP